MAIVVLHEDKLFPKESEDILRLSKVVESLDPYLICLIGLLKLGNLKGEPGTVRYYWILLQLGTTYSSRQNAQGQTGRSKSGEY